MNTRLKKQTSNTFLISIKPRRKIYMLGVILFVSLFALVFFALQQEGNL